MAPCQRIKSDRQRAFGPFSAWARVKCLCGSCWAAGTLGHLGARTARPGVSVRFVRSIAAADVWRDRRQAIVFWEIGAMREAVVVASSRTPLAKSFRGSFNLTRPDDLAAHCISDVLGKVPQLDPAEIEDVILGCAEPSGQQGQNVARVAAIRAGLPVTRGGHHGQPLLLVRLAGDRDGGAPDPPRRCGRGDRRRRREHHGLGQ